MAKEKEGFKAASLARFSPLGNAAKQAMIWSPDMSAIVDADSRLVELKRLIEQGDVSGANESAQFLLKALKSFDKKHRKLLKPFLMMLDGDSKTSYNMYSEAEISYSEVAKEAKKSGDKLLQSVALSFLGMSLWQQRNYKDALKQMEQAIKVNSRYVEALINKGVAEIELGRPKKAVDSFDKALSVEMQNALAWVNKGAALISIGKHKDAMSWLDLAINADKTDALANYNKGLVLEEQKKFDKAAACFEIAFNGKEELPDNGTQLYFAWTNLMLSQILKMISSNDMKKADQMILNFKRLTASAASDGVGDRINEAMDLYKTNMPKKEREHFSVFEYKMQTIQDALMLWGSLRDWVSKKWPGGLTVAVALKGER
ncbi:tetratricopeptide repeat protein [Chloroflexota bacterium]